MEKMIIVDFEEYMELLENYRKLDVKNRDLQKKVDVKTDFLGNILSAIEAFEDGKLNKGEFFYVIDDLINARGVKEK